MEEKKQIYAALSRAQGVMMAAKKGETNPFFKSKYSDLADVCEAIKEPLSSNGLSYTHTFRHEGELIIMITTLWHASGESIASEMPMILTKKDPQCIGSTISPRIKKQFVNEYSCFCKHVIINKLFELPS